MKKEVLELLCCPSCKHDLKVLRSPGNNLLASKETLICSYCQMTYKINEGVVDFLESEEEEEK
ncbi:MAG: Trm112 family protein [Candidatus Hodarchaeota archaeon]